MKEEVDCDSSIGMSPLNLTLLFSFSTGLGIGLNSLNQIGNDIRDYRQEGEIQRTRAELANSQQREAEMEARLRVLELAQKNPTMSTEDIIKLMQQQQLQLQQQQQQQQLQQK